MTINRAVKGAAERLWHLGFNVTTIAVDAKEPAHSWNNDRAPWAAQRQPLAVVQSLPADAEQRIFKGSVYPAIATVGVINGVNNRRTIDVDACKRDGEKVAVPAEVRTALLDALGLPLGYAWGGSSASGKGFHAIVECAGLLPDAWRTATKKDESGVIVFDPLPAYAEAFDHIELRWERCQTRLPGPTGYNGHLPDTPPSAVSVEQLVAALGRIATPHQRVAVPRTSRPAQAPREQQGEHQDVIGQFNAAYGVEELLERNGYTRTDDGWEHPRTSQPGVTGLRVEGSRVRSYSATDPLNDGAHSHDAFSLFCELEHRSDMSAAVKAAAEALGLPPLENTRTPTQLSRALVLRCLGEGEAGDAQLFAALYDGRLVYDHRESTWYAFEGHAWHATTGTPRQRVWSRVAGVYLSLAGELQAAGEKAGEEDKPRLFGQVEALIDRAKKLRALNRCNNVLTLAQELLGIAGDEWDSDPWLMGVANGVLNLRTGQLRDGQPQDYIRTTSPTAWQGLDAACPRWARFVSEVLSDEADRVAFLQRLLGYSLNGTTREHVLALLIGERGRNGKRVLMETLQGVLGAYAGTVSTDVVIGQDRWRGAGSAQPHLMDLLGKRLVTCSETGEHDQLSTAQVKNITGGDEIRARRLHENLIAFKPTHTLFLQTNHKPHAPADDDALWERVKVIEFKVRFVEEPKDADERPRDPTLEPALRNEASGILAWLVRGHLDWLKNGLRTPESVKVARDSYRKGESIEPFIADRCIEWDDGSVEGGVAYAAYEQWCTSNQLQPKTPHWFGRQMVTRYEKGRGANGRACYYGVSLNEEKKASEGIGTRNTDDRDDGFTRFSDAFTPLSKSSEPLFPREEKNLEQGSKASEASESISDTPQAAGPIGIAQHGEELVLVTEWNEAGAVAAGVAEPIAADALVWPTPPVDLAYVQRAVRGGFDAGLGTHCAMRQVDPAQVRALIAAVFTDTS